jgi:hypothetical protein
LTLRHGPLYEVRAQLHEVRSTLRAVIWIEKVGRTGPDSSLDPGPEQAPAPLYWVHGSPPRASDEARPYRAPNPGRSYPDARPGKTCVHVRVDRIGECLQVRALEALPRSVHGSAGQFRGWRFHDDVAPLVRERGI